VADTGRTWLKEKVRERCERLRDSCEARELATEAEIAEVWPDEPDRATKDDWWWAHSFLIGFRQREGEVTTTLDEAEDEVLSAQLEQPESVRVVDPTHADPRSEDAETSVSVYPKGLNALMGFRARDYVVDYIQRHAEYIRRQLEAHTLDRETFPNPESMIEELETETAHQLCVMASAATQEGPAVDWKAASEYGPFWSDMDPMHYLRVIQAFAEVNAHRLEALPYVAGPQKQEGEEAGRVSWNVFMGSMASKMDTTVRELAENTSLVALLAQARLSAPDMEELEDEF